MRALKDQIRHRKTWDEGGEGMRSKAQQGMIRHVYGHRLVQPWVPTGPSQTHPPTLDDPRAVIPATGLAKLPLVDYLESTGYNGGQVPPETWKVLRRLIRDGSWSAEDQRSHQGTEKTLEANVAPGKGGRGYRSGSIGRRNVGRPSISASCGNIRLEC